jgi:PKHD-type hydroxylase
MTIAISDVLNSAQVDEARKSLDAASWVDGKGTAGHQAVQAKDNQQLPVDHPAGKKVGEMIVAALGQNPLFLSAALPLRILPPLFNRYAGGQHFGTHVDGAIRQVPGTPHRLRTDLSATLFLAGPEEYDGGELEIQDTYGSKTVKLPAGHMILYPATSLHHVKPVTWGVRLCSFFWIQSIVRQDADRALLFELDVAIQRLNADHPKDPSAVQFTGIYHNLLRKWAEM